jgi:hypothetical protein
VDLHRDYEKFKALKTLGFLALRFTYRFIEILGLENIGVFGL